MTFGTLFITRWCLSQKEMVLIMKKSKIVWLCIMTVGLIGAVVGTITDIALNGMSISSFLSICFCILLGIWWVNYYRFGNMFVFSKSEAEKDDKDNDIDKK